MKTTTTICSLASILLVSACATPVSPEKLASADYGPPPPAGYEEVIKARFHPMLIDPTSPLYEFQAPRKGYTMPSSLHRTGESYGWVVCGTVNSKNRMGGYSGKLPFFALFSGGQLVEFVPGEPHSRSFINDNIGHACNRSVPDRQ